MQNETPNSRRGFLKATAGAGLVAVSSIASAQSFDFKPNQRYPDAAVPERCANLCFGGPKNNRLYMANCHPICALYVESHGAT